MSARVSSATSASSSASASSAVGGARPPVGAPADGAAGSDAPGATGGARNSSAAGPGPNPGPGAGGGASFSSAIADAAHGQDARLGASDGTTAGAKAAGAKAAGASDGGGAKAGGAKASGSSDDTNVDTGNSAAAAASNAAPVAASITVRDVSSDAAPAAGQSLTQPLPSAADQASNVRAGRPAARPGAGARTAVKDAAAAVTTDPVVLAMLLAASGMQMSNGADANGAADAASSAPAIAVTGDATAAAAAGQPGQPGQAAAVARDTPAQPDARTAAGSIGNAWSDPAALSAKSAASAGQGDAASIGTGAAGLPELVRSFTITGPQGAVVEATIPVPLSSAGWPHAVAAQVHWFVNNDVQSATLRLSPDHLGPVEVHIDVQQSQVNVNFSAANAETRAALEQTVPRLREIFASGGLTLGQTNVQADPRSGSQPAALPVRTVLAHAQTVEPVAVAATHALGLVDEYA
jgi:flagellar hook-length control protein FliK